MKAATRMQLAAKVDKKVNTECSIAGGASTAALMRRAACGPAGSERSACTLPNSLGYVLPLVFEAEFNNQLWSLALNAMITTLLRRQLLLPGFWTPDYGTQTLVQPCRGACRPVRRHMHTHSGCVPRNLPPPPAPRPLVFCIDGRPHPLRSIDGDNFGHTSHFLLPFDAVFNASNTRRAPGWGPLLTDAAAAPLSLVGLTRTCGPLSARGVRQK